MDQPWNEETYAYLRDRVSRHFRVYDEKRGVRSILLYIEMPPGPIDFPLSLLRDDLRDYRLYFTRSEGEDGIMVVDKAALEVKPRLWLHALLFALTVITTGMAGSIWYYSFLGVDFILSPEGVGYGFLLFGLPLMATLGTHEMGHYLMSKKLGVAATPPFFIPIPPIPGFFPLGTMGAVITMRSPMENRSALVRIGAAGPLAGFVVAIIVIIIGLWTSYPAPMPMADPHAPSIPLPILTHLLATLFGYTGVIVPSPTFMAGWVGLFVTALNLLPVGQLDGGHISRAIFKKGSGIIYMALIVLFGFMTFFVNPFYINFLFIMFIITMLGGVRHPPPLDDVSPLEPIDILLIALSGVAFFLCLPI
jgi:hypothetical protein